MVAEVTGEVLSHDPSSFIIQGSDLPVFCCLIKSDQCFVCKVCSHILIENYFEDMYCGISIKCFQCSGMNKVPGLSLGEVLSVSAINMGSGKFFLNEPVKVPAGRVVTTDEEFKKSLSLTYPRNYNEKLILSPDHINILIKKYDNLTGSKFDTQYSIIKRGGIKSKEEYPFAWAVKILTDYEINLNNADTVHSIFCLQAFSHVVGIWEHHPRFRIVASGLGKKREFFHTIYQLISAAHLFRQGNPIGISIGDKHGEPNPDLYIRGLAEHPKIYIEIKAPNRLQRLAGSILEESEVEKTVKDCLKRSSGQINKDRPGILVIGSNLNLGSKLDRAVIKSLESDGRNHKNLFAIFFINLTDLKIIPTNHKYEFGAETTFSFDKHLNAFYDGKQIFDA